MSSNAERQSDLSPGENRPLCLSPFIRRPYNLIHPLYNLRFFILRLFSVASVLKIIYTKRAGRAVLLARTRP
jgi:hypothetical protein